MSEPIHPLDLPVIAREPPAAILLDVLNRLRVVYRNHSTPEKLEPGVVQWLTRVVADELAWIEDADVAEQIREAAASRLAAECGVSARSKTTRELDVAHLTLSLYEPGLTEDNLGFTTWGSSLVLSRRLAIDPQLLGSGRVLELGAGTGLCGITAAKLGNDVLLTDLPEIVDNIATNIDLNSVNDVASAKTLDWSHPHDEHAENIIVADPVYSKQHPAWLLSAISNTRGCTTVLLQFPMRPGWEAERQEVYDGLVGLGFNRKTYIEEAGEDDYGSMTYGFSHWTRAIEVN